MKVAKSLLTAAVAVMFVGVVSSWAQEFLLLDGPSPVEVKGKLTSGVKVEDILPGDLSVATLVFVSPPSFTGDVFRVLGTGISGSNANSGIITGTFAVGTAILESDNSVDVSKGNSKTTKEVSSWFDSTFDLFTGSFTNLSSIVSNAEFIASTSDSKSKIRGKFVGIWNEGRDAVKGSIKAGK